MTQASPKPDPPAGSVAGRGLFGRARRFNSVGFSFAWFRGKTDFVDRENRAAHRRSHRLCTSRGIVLITTPGFR